MGSYSAPSHPPPPKLPEGWKPIWDDRYSEYFYVNLNTSESTWDKPTQPAHDTQSYSPKYGSQDRSLGFLSRSKNKETDEEMARRLHNEERNRQNRDGDRNTTRGEAHSYYSGEPVSHGPLDQEGIHNGTSGSQASRGISGTGLRARIRERIGSGSGPRQYYPPSQGPMYGGPPPPQMYMSGPVYAPPPQPYNYGMPPQPMYMQQPMRRRQGMGPGGGAALGLGGGLLGGMMLGNAMNNGQQDAYQDGFADGADFDGGDMDCGDCGE